MGGKARVGNHHKKPVYGRVVGWVDGQVGGGKSRFKDSLQQSKMVQRKKIKLIKVAEKV